MPLHGLEHALVLTDDLERTKAFYCEVLGFEVGERPPLPFPGYWLSLDGAACLHVAERAAYEAHAADVGLRRSNGPIDHLAFAADGHEALAARLEAAEVEVVTNDVPAAGIRQLFIDDPNGVRIELNLAPGSEPASASPQPREDP
jgi:catechol 2,3-dioxygenase-like lactoylglutathione lyase family enzyme